MQRQAAAQVSKFLWVLAFVALVGCEQPRGRNYNVNEHNFLRVLRASGDADIATILGDPDTTGEGEIIQSLAA